jgi:hypothetical protein
MFQVAIMIVIIAQGASAPAIDRFTSKDTYKTLAECNASLPARKADFIPRFKKHFANMPVKAGWHMDCEPVNEGKIDKDGNLSGPEKPAEKPGPNGERSL